MCYHIAGAYTLLTYEGLGLDVEGFYTALPEREISVAGLQLRAEYDVQY
jgi:hypothetical protein